MFCQCLTSSPKALISYVQQVLFIKIIRIVALQHNKINFRVSQLLQKVECFARSEISMIRNARKYLLYLIFIFTDRLAGLFRVSLSEFHVRVVKLKRVCVHHGYHSSLSEKLFAVIMTGENFYTDKFTFAAVVVIADKKRASQVNQETRCFQEFLQFNAYRDLRLLARLS